MSSRKIYSCNVCGDEKDPVRLFAIYHNSNKSGDFELVKHGQHRFDSTDRHVCFDCGLTLLNELSRHKRMDSGLPNANP